MLSRMHFPSRRRVLAGASLLLGVAMVALQFPAALALREGAEGNTPIKDPGWPKGAAAIFNHTARIAYWTGSFGGEWTGEYRGDTKTFNAVLADFAKLEVKTKRLIIYDGVGASYWLSATRNGDDPAKKDAAKMDWSFMVWQTEAGQRQAQRARSGLAPRDDKEAPSEITVYTGDNIKWSDVNVPDGLVIDDQRMSAHGFSLDDGNVFEGKVIDLATKKPLAARIRLRRLDYRKDGEYDYTYVSGTVADEKGHWVLTNVPAATYQVLAEQEGYVTRIATWQQLMEQPRWHACDTGLARPAPISGRVVDEAGAPLADVNVRIDSINVKGSGGYSCPNERTKTDADGRFQMDQIPQGRTTVWINKPGYFLPGSGPSITTPKADIALTMKRAGRTVVTVDFAAVPKKPKIYIVHIEAEGGPGVGKWGGGGNVNEKNQIVYENVPPGKYVIWGMPNPGNDKEKTDPIAVELKGGETSEVTLKAKGLPPRPPDPQLKPKRPPTSTDTF